MWNLNSDFFILDQQKKLKKDPNVFTYMMQLVQQKYGDDVDSGFLEKNANDLYDKFAEELVSYFSPILSPEQKKSFDSMLENNVPEEKMVAYLFSIVDDVEGHIKQILDSFKDTYLNVEE